MNQLFIPTRIKVGFQERNDTYSKRLAYIIYYDEKNKLRKEASWESWRNKNIEPQEFDNTPTEGFVLNKKAGGYSTGWNHRQTYCRIYDPRGFEFEISIPNLLYILEHTDCVKGKGLLGSFVYSYDGKDLVLLPVNTEDYQKCVEYTDLQSKRVSSKDFKEGCIYEDNKQRQFVYLGKRMYYQEDNIWKKGNWKKDVISYKKVNEHIWKSIGDSWRTIPSKIVREVSNVPVDNYAFLVEEWCKDKLFKPFTSFEKVYFDTENYTNCRFMEINGNIYHIYIQTNNYPRGEWDFNSKIKSIIKYNPFIIDYDNQTINKSVGSGTMIYKEVDLEFIKKNCFNIKVI